MGYQQSRGELIAQNKRAKALLFGEPRKSMPKRKLKRVSATRAKTLTTQQFERLLRHVAASRHVTRDTALFMISYYCGLRPQEIAGLRWKRNILDSEGRIGEFVHVTKDIGKRTKERMIPMHPELKGALRRLRAERPNDTFVVHALFDKYTNSERSHELSHGQQHPNTLAQYMRRFYKECGFEGCSGYSGRRTFGTNLARRCNEVGASIRDVQLLMGHASLESTEAYIEPSSNQKMLVQHIF